MIKFAHERQVRHTCTFTEHFIRFHPLVESVDTKDLTNDELRTVVLPPEFNNITSNLESHFFLKLMILIPQLRSHRQLIRVKRQNLYFGIKIIIVIYPTTLFQTVYKNNVKIKKQNGLFRILDRNCVSSHSTKISKHATINIIQLNNLQLTL